jgi:hypothetical protein
MSGSAATCFVAAGDVSRCPAVRESAHPDDPSQFTSALESSSKPDARMGSSPDLSRVNPVLGARVYGGDVLASAMRRLIPVRMLSIPHAASVGGFLCPFSTGFVLGAAG